LPLDPMGAQNRTLGGIVATNHSGPLRLLYGTCRDLVLGMKIVLPDATIIRAGGKTVKNVAGYDLSKLFIGSMGSLGVIAEITFKLFPLPANSETLWATYNQFDEIPDLIQSIGASNLVVSRCEYLNRIFIEKYMDNDYGLKGSHHILFNVQGNAEMVKTTIEKLRQLVLEKGAKNIQLFSKKDNTKLWGQISSLNLSNKKSGSDYHCRVSIPKASFGSVINSIENFSNNNMLLSLAIQAHAGSGIIHIYCGDWKEEQMSPDRCRSQIESLRKVVKNHNGHMVIEQAPDPSRESAMIWGEPGSDFPLMKTIKTSYDQHQIFVAGRFIGGL
jgi:glycolate oxidase FAD binding subunit